MLILEKSFQMMKNIARLDKLEEIISATVKKNLLQKGFNSIKSRKEKSIKSKLSIILLETLISQNRKEQKKAAVSKFNQNKRKIIGVQKIMKLVFSKYSSTAQFFFANGLNILNLNKLLMRLKRGQALQRILQRQDESLKKIYLNKMRKKSNIWMELAMKKFATRASIRSSPAIALWRLKTYMLNT